MRAAQKCSYFLGCFEGRSRDLRALHVSGYDDENHLQAPAYVLAKHDASTKSGRPLSLRIITTRVLLRCGARAHSPHISRQQRKTSTLKLHGHAMTHSHPFEPSHLASARTGTLTSVASLSLCPPPWVATPYSCARRHASSCEPPTSAASSAQDRHVERHVERLERPGPSLRWPCPVPSHPSQSLPD